MDNITPIQTVSHLINVNELVNPANRQDFHNEINSATNSKVYEIRLLHHNVQSLSNKLLDIAILLATDYSNINILCFTEHWLLEAQLQVLNIDGFKLVSNFSRSHSASGGSCIFVRNTTEAQEVTYLRKLGKERVFEVSAMELSTNNTILACIYRSPDSDFYTFLHTLELLISKVFSKGKHLVLCGDLNINFLQQSSKLADFRNLLAMNNLTNIVKSPTRISNRSVSLIDVMIISNTDKDTFTLNQNLGYSDHLAQLLYLKSNKPNGGTNC